MMDAFLMLCGAVLGIAAFMFVLTAWSADRCPFCRGFTQWWRLFK